MKNRTKLSPLFKNEKGVAIIMVMASITLMTLILATFTYDTKVNKLRIYNQQEKIQARLNAESGLKMGIVYLRLYQEARNLMENNENIKKIISPEKIQSIITQIPIMSNFPVVPGSNLIQKNAISEFNESILLTGEMMGSITPVRGFLNPNAMRLDLSKLISLPQTQVDLTQPPSEQTKAAEKRLKEISEFTEERIKNALELAYDKKRESDDLFNNLYSNLDINLLVKELKFYVMDKDDFKDTELAQIRPFYENKNITPKHAPLTSLSELQLLEGWDDEIISLIEDQITVQESTVINVKEITKNQLMFLFPTIEEFQAEEYFDHVNGNSEKAIDPREIFSVAEFKQLLTATINIVDPSEYEKRIKLFEKANIKLDVANLLFKIEVTGRYNRAEHNIQAFVNIPTRDITPPAKPTPKPVNEPETVARDEDDEGEDEEPNEEPPPEDSTDGKPPKIKLEFLMPRAVEINIM